MSFFIIFALAYAQTITFSLSSRARNRDHMKYLFWTTVCSNLIWYLCFRELVLNEMSLFLLFPYTAGTTFGALSGVKVSMFIEKKINASADAHLSKR